jgi:hypothetical protein
MLSGAFEGLTSLSAGKNNGIICKPTNKIGWRDALPSPADFI